MVFVGVVLSRRHLGGLAGLAVWACAGLCGQDTPAGAPVSPPPIQAGAGFRLPWAPIGGEVPVFVPTDYDPDRRWPVIVSYPGQGGEPSTDLFRMLTGGEGAIIVGMGYTDSGKDFRTAEEKYAHQLQELAQLERLLNELPRRLRVDRSRVFLAGVSKGGWQVSAFAQSARPAVAGYVILLAGRLPRGRADRPDLAGRAVYVGTGEHDQGNAYARMAVQFFDRCGADVTWEEYPDRGHELNLNAPRLKAWLTMLLGEQDDDRRRQAQDWVARRLTRAKDTAVASDCHKALTAIAEDPRYRFAGETLQAQVQSLLEQMSLRGDVQPGIQARRIYERALWEEQTAAGLSDLESALGLYQQAAKRYPKTTHGRLARRDADRLQPLVDAERSAVRARAPRVSRPKIIITK